MLLLSLYLGIEVVAPQIKSAYSYCKKAMAW